ncbi:hypothetical protein CEP52_017546 [Fusarium oligoseptatum]|uniref:Uncharacterized protein n=2 Tax=Fusarium solani species complex TaxID=232080 RepID=A0A428RP46_9HYPO|nr:hypothetical protein CEP51_016685 [Fusarium floridanum]RSL79239.1 hypothetical protein CEP52_017546 [Fusarium oligoseptatum]
MGHSSKHDKSKRHERKGTRGDRKKHRSSTAQLQTLIANVQERQQSLARQHDEYTHLQEQAEHLRARLENAEQTLELLSSTSLAAQQARGVAPLSSHPGQQTIDRASRKRHLEREIDAMDVSIDEYNRRAAALAELIARGQGEIERLQMRIDEIRAAEEAEAEAPWYGEQQGGPDQGWGGDPSTGGGGGSYGYYGGGQASSSAFYGEYGDTDI